LRPSVTSTFVPAASDGLPRAGVERHWLDEGEREALAGRVRALTGLAAG